MGIQVLRTMQELRIKTDMETDQSQKVAVGQQLDRYGELMGAVVYGSEKTRQGPAVSIVPYSGHPLHLTFLRPDR